ncbi:hypothetical protein ACP70R_035986 [Stipagrostis hirtigluma subsp. patula]
MASELRSPFFPADEGQRSRRISAAAAWAVTVPLLLLLLVIVSSSSGPSFFLDALRSSRRSSANLVELTLVTGAQEKGAVCLDGSPSAYHLQRGSGSGSQSWIIHLQGGGWCYKISNCAGRSKSPVGSSTYMGAIAFEGILSNDQLTNPDFYNWNRVYVRYCDGASYSGDSLYEDESGNKLFFRGQRIWEAIIDELKEKGLAQSKEAILTGCSAGGLGALLHCNQFREQLPQEIPVKCLPDAGFFLDIEDLSGKRTQWSRYEGAVHLQNVTKVLPKECLAEKEDPAECFFPAEVIKSIKIPTFIINSAYDSWQIQNSLAPEKSLPDNSWLSCRANIRNCSSTQIQVLSGFRKKMLQDLKAVEDNKDWGWFIDSCFAHCQTVTDISWNSPVARRLGNKTMAEAFGDWYFGRSSSEREIDCEYPCNPPCSPELPSD